MGELMTGIVYDEAMLTHRCPWDENYPECPERLSSVINRCKELGLVERCKRLPTTKIREEDLLLCHSQAHVDKLRETKAWDDAKREEFCSNYHCIYVHETTYDCSLMAAGCMVSLAEAIAREEVRNGMALVRPPGHHAMKEEYNGYCMFNNVAVAAQKLLSEHGLERILVIDWDVHHGQATQQRFYESNSVLYFSIHRYENGSFWPNLRESNFDFVGSGPGRGFNVNVPLNATGMTNSDFAAIWFNLLLPIAHEYKPQLVLVSAGYDAALGCPEGEMEVTPAFYAHLLTPLMALAEGKIAVALEGGYCLSSLAEGAALTLRALLGDPCPLVGPIGAINPIMESTILDLKFVLRPFWKALSHHPLAKDGDEGGGDSSVASLHVPRVVFYGAGVVPPTDTRDCYPVQEEILRATMEDRIQKLILGTRLTFAPERVALVFDKVMKLHQPVSGNHPENPNRIQRIYDKLKEDGLVDKCRHLKSRKGKQEEVALLHERSLLDLMASLSDQTKDDLDNMSSSYNSIYFCPQTNESALHAVGSLLQVVDSVLNGETRSGAAVIRPPGHHAEADSPCGFCFYNNVALAASYAVNMHGLKRVLILDWDVHHGNGTQHMFESDPRVLYVSLHRYDNGGFFPCSTDAHYSCVGLESGKGFNVNIPWNLQGRRRMRMGDAEYLQGFFQVILPIAYSFDPELVLVSAGFDAAQGDPLGGYNVSFECYAHMTHLLMPLASGRIILALEGGYNLSSISESMSLCVQTLLGRPPPPLPSSFEPKEEAMETLQCVIRALRPYWPVLPCLDPLPDEAELLKPSLLKPECRMSCDSTGTFPDSDLSVTSDMLDSLMNDRMDDSAPAADSVSDVVHRLEGFSFGNSGSFTSGDH